MVKDGWLTKWVGLREQGERALEARETRVLYYCYYCIY